MSLVQERWVIVCQKALDVGYGGDVRTGGSPELGYALISNAATFDSESDAIKHHHACNLPLGWVVMPLSRLLPDLYQTKIKDISPSIKVLKELDEIVQALIDWRNALYQKGRVIQGRDDPFLVINDILYKTKVKPFVVEHP